MSEENAIPDGFPIRYIGVDEKLPANTLPKMPARPKITVKQDGKIAIAADLAQNTGEPIAAVLLTGEEMLQLLHNNLPIAIRCDSDTDSKEIPTAGQRKPTKDRRKKIRAAWANTNQTPDSKLEDIFCSGWGIIGKKTSNGVELIFDPKHSLLVISDGGGRMSACIDEFDDIVRDGRPYGDHIVCRRNIQFLLVIDLSGKVDRELQHFVARNRDAKRTNKGTNMVTENAILSLTDRIPEMDDTAYPTYIVRKLYERNLSGSLLSHMPWSYEGMKAGDGAGFEGSQGSASNLVTAIKACMGKIGPKLNSKFWVKELDYTTEELIEALDFGFRVIYDMCHELRAEMAKWENEEVDPKERARIRLFKALGVKILALLIIRLWKRSGDNQRKFAALVNETISMHWQLNGREYTNKKRQKMDINIFWKECRIVCEKTFNSGQVNTKVILDQFSQILDLVESGKHPKIAV